MRMIALSSANKCPPIDSVRELSIDIATHLSPQTLPRQEILKQMESSQKMPRLVLTTSSSTIREMKIGIGYSLSPILR